MFTDPMRAGQILVKTSCTKFSDTRSHIRRTDSLVWSVNCVICQLCGLSIVWSVNCVVCYLCQEPLELQYTS